MWQDVIKIIETNQFLSTKYKEVIDKLKSEGYQLWNLITKRQ
jgi:hypothetical protein